MVEWKGAAVALHLLVPVVDFDAIGPSVWCAETEGLVRQLEQLGGKAVKRVYAGDGRTFVWYWNDYEEAVVEHDSNGSSCLLRINSSPQ
jgi:hypothetical protein